jgi:hypothetical protein
MLRERFRRLWRSVNQRREQVARPKRRRVIDSDLALGPEERRETAAWRDWTRI